MRMANLLASVDANASIGENESIAAMQRQFDELQGRAPEHLANEVDTNNARDALKWLRDEARRLREGVAVTSAEKPTPTPTGSGPAPSRRDESQPASKSDSEDTRTPQQRLADARAKTRSADRARSHQRSDRNADQFLDNGAATGNRRVADDTAQFAHGVCRQSRYR